MPQDIIYRTDLRKLITEEPFEIATQIVKSYQDTEEEIRGFVLDKFYQKNTDMDVKRVTGSNHPDYINQPWSYLITDGKRSSIRLDELAKTPEYYLSDIQEEKPNFVKIGQDIFIVGDGNNRTIIAKFFFHFNRDKIDEPLLRNVTLTEYVVDWESLIIKKEIDSLLNETRFAHLSLTLLTDNFSNGCSDKCRWHLYNNELDGEDRSIKLTRAELPALLAELKSDNFLKRLFGRGYSKNLRTNIFF